MARYTFSITGVLYVLLMVYVYLFFIFTSFFPKLLYENGLVKIKGHIFVLFSNSFQALLICAHINAKCLRLCMHTSHSMYE